MSGSFFFFFLSDHIVVIVYGRTGNVFFTLSQKVTSGPESQIGSLSCVVRGQGCGRDRTFVVSGAGKHTSSCFRPSRRPDVIFK